MDDAGRLERVGALVDELTRTLAGAAPPPRGLACFGLESRSGTAAALLDRLSAHGIYRKYELVLTLGDALGTTGRWLADRLGCSAVATAPTPAVAGVAARLSRRAGLRARVHHVPAAVPALPFADAAFTHVWVVESLGTTGDPAAAFAAAHRVLRPGGHLAVQELLQEPTPADATPPAVGLAATVRSAGFVSLLVRDVTGEAAERAAQVSAARERLHALLRASGDACLAAEADARLATAAALDRRSLRVVQVLARRP